MNVAEPSSWHHLPANSVAELLNTSIAKGLTSDEAARRLAERGYNELHERPRPGFWQMLLAQFNNFVIWILIVASVIAALLGDYIEAAAIMAIVILNAVVGVIQEGKAEEALAALKKMAAPDAHVIRDGARVTIPARELVPGDVVILEAGNYVPSDVRLVESINLKIDEASLTGESFPIQKDAARIAAVDSVLGDRRNMAFMGTMATYGRGQGLVVSTGMETEMGRIAEMIQSYEEEPTPLQVRLDQLGKWLGWGSLIICGAGLCGRGAARCGLGYPEPVGAARVSQGRARDHRRTLFGRHQSGDRGRARGIAGHRDGQPGAGDARDGQAQRADPPPAGSRDAGQRQHHLLGQDRHADPERDDGRAALGLGRAPAGHR